MGGRIRQSLEDETIPSLLLARRFRSNPDITKATSKMVRANMLFVATR